MDRSAWLPDEIPHAVRDGTAFCNTFPFAIFWHADEAFHRDPLGGNLAPGFLAQTSSKGILYLSKGIETSIFEIVCTTSPSLLQTSFREKELAQKSVHRNSEGVHALTSILEGFCEEVYSKDLALKSEDLVQIPLPGVLGEIFFKGCKRDILQRFLPKRDTLESRCASLKHGPFKIPFTILKRPCAKVWWRVLGTQG